MDVYTIVAIIFTVSIIGVPIYFAVVKNINIFTLIERRMKYSQVKQDIINIKAIHQRAIGEGKKISFLEKGKVKKQFDESHNAFRKYVEYCRTKKLELTEEEKSLLTVIQETEDLLDPSRALEREMERANAEYQGVYREVNASGEWLLKAREESSETISQIEDLVNSIAKHPKEFDKDIKEIEINKTDFKNALEFGEQQKKALKVSAEGAGAGVAAGAAVAGLAPSAAMWVATTFGTASTGTAISALSGAAAHNAALAWLGGWSIGNKWRRHGGWPGISRISWPGRLDSCGRFCSGKRIAPVAPSHEN